MEFLLRFCLCGCIIICNQGFMRDGSDGTPSCGHGRKAPTIWEKGRKNGLQSQCFGNRRAFLVRTEVQALLFRERRRKLQRFMPERDAGSLLWEKAGLQGQCFEGASVSIPCDLWKNLRKSLIGAFDGNSLLWCGMRGDLGCVKAESKQKEGECDEKIIDRLFPYSGPAADE